MRKAGPLLAVELGGTVSGSLASIRTGGKLAAELFAHARYDAVVLASGDLLLPDLDGLLAVKVPWISANVYRDGKRLTAPYVTVGDVAIVGLTDQAPTGALPDGIEVRDPARELEAVRAELPMVQGRKPRLVVATALSVVEMPELRGALRLGRAGGVATGFPAEEIPGGAIAVAPTATELGIVVDVEARDVGSVGGPLSTHDVTSAPVSAPLDDTARAILERYGVLPSATASPSPTSVDAEPVGGVWAAKSRAAELEVFGFKLQPSYAKVRAPEGGTLVLVDTHWRNVLPLGLVYGQVKSTSYRFPNLRDHAYLVADGCRLLRIAEDADGAPGHLKVHGFELPDLGSTRRGWLAFVADTPPQKSLQLRVYDFAHGHFFIDLMGAPPAPEAPMVPMQTNEVLEAGVFGVRTLGEWRGMPAPAGKTFVAVEVRARSHFTQEVEARVFDPHAAEGAKMQLGTVSDWTEANRHAQLVVDGIYATPPLTSSPLGDAPRFLPDELTGAEFVFLAPADFKSLALRGDFPNARLPGGAVIRPKGLTFALRGEVPPAAAAEPLGAVDDDTLRFELLSASATPAGRDRLVTCTVRVQVRGERGETFQTRDQLLLTLADASQRAYDAEASAALAFAPSPLLFIPPTSTRVFAVAFRAPLVGKLRLGYRGLTLQKFFDLPLADLLATEPTPAEKPAEKPVPKPQPAPPAPPKPKPEPSPAPVPAPPPAVTPDPTAAPKPAPVARGLAGVGLTPAQVNAAIDRGADGLWAFIAKDLKLPHYYYGHTPEHILTSLALLHAGAHRRIPAFDAALQAHLRRVEPMELRTYELGLLCMVIESYGDPAFLPKLHVAARRLFEGQGPQGAWDYEVLVPADRLADPEAGQALKVYGGIPLDGELPPWERVEGKNEDGDNSVTQYALLGLRAAANAGVPLPADVWQRALTLQRARQCGDGSWAYSTEWTGYGSMTGAGIAAVAICKHALGEGSALGDSHAQKGLAWLAANFSVQRHPKHGGWDFYYLYSLERVGRLLDTEFIGEHEWYPLGARYLVDRQDADGMWQGVEGHEKSDPRLPTSFALLFLTRATEALSPLNRRGGTGQLRASVAIPPALRLYLVLDASGSMLEPMAGKPRFEWARGAVTTLLDALPDNAQVALRAYGHRKRSIEAGAEEDTELLVPWTKLAGSGLRDKLAALRARGRTPLTLSLQQAKGELGTLDPKNPLIFVLLTDGGDDTRQRQGFLEAAKAITARGGVRFHVVGFAIDRPDWTAQIQKAAAAAGGAYVPATDATSLAQTLRTVVFGIPDGFTVRGPDGKERQAGFGEVLTLPEGKYEVSVTFGEQRLVRTAWVNTGGHTGVVFDALKLTR